MLLREIHLDIDGIMWAVIRTITNFVGTENGFEHTRNTEVAILVGDRNTGTECFGVVYLRTLLNKQMWMAHIQPFCQPFVNMSWDLWDHAEIMCATKGATLIDDLYSISRDRTLQRSFSSQFGVACVSSLLWAVGYLPCSVSVLNLARWFLKLAIDSKTWASPQNISQFPKGTPHWNQVDWWSSTCCVFLFDESCWHICIHLVIFFPRDLVRHLIHCSLAKVHGSWAQHFEQLRWQFFVQTKAVGQTFNTKLAWWFWAAILMWLV